MKVIDILNKMANDDNFRPDVIKFYDDLFTWDSQENDWKNEDNSIGLLEYNFPNTLNNEVEIIEEEKKIPEKLEILPDNEHYSNKILYGKINDIIDYLYYLKSKGE